jgi:hypothetical protein
VIRFLSQHFGAGDNLLRRPVIDSFSSSSSAFRRIEDEDEEDLPQSHET